MTKRTLALDDLRERTAEDILRKVAAEQEEWTVHLPDGGDVQIRPVPRLEPLPVLEGYVPEGWKDAINGPGEWLVSYQRGKR